METFWGRREGISMNSVFIAFCIITSLMLVLIIALLIGIYCIDDEELLNFLIRSLIGCTLIFLILIPVTACTWKSNEDLYMGCKLKTDNKEYCSKYLGVK